MTHPLIRWVPISQADISIVTEINFEEVGIRLRNSERYWVRDADGRAYEAAWTDHRQGYWWDFEAESPTDPVEFAPHPLDPRWPNDDPAPAPRVLDAAVLRDLFAILANIDRWELEERGLVPAGKAGGDKWARFNQDLTTFTVKLTTAQLATFWDLIASKLPASETAS